jgi:hypothetical protein
MILPRTIRLVVPGNGVDLPVLSEPEVDAGITVTRPEDVCSCACAAAFFGPVFVLIVMYIEKKTE